MRSDRWYPALLFLPACLAAPTLLGAQSAETRPVPSIQSDSVYRLGLNLLRRARTDDGRYFDRARDAFRKAHELDPDWATPLLGIGLAEAGKGDWLAHEPLNIGTRVGHGAYRASIRALVTTLSKDPHLTAAIVEMDRVALALRDTAVDRQVLMTIRAAVGAGNTDQGALLILGRRERAAGNAREAITSFRGYLVAGQDSELARYEIARSLLTAGEEGGESSYFDIGRSTDSITVAEMRADLVPIAGKDELARFDESSGPERQSFLRRFWEDRARRDLRSTDERLREHFRRLQVARHRFVLSNNRRYYGMRDLYRAPQSETLDDRGVVYVRHGEPDERLRPTLFGLLPNETWLYRRPDGDLLMHFSAGGESYEGGDLTDYRLVSSVFDLRGDRTPKDLLISSRFGVSDLYQKIMAWGPLGARRAIEEEQQWGEASAQIGTTTDGYGISFPVMLEAATDFISIGRPGGASQLHLIYALPAELGPGTPVRARLAVFESRGQVRAGLDRVATSEPMGSARSGGRFEVEVPPGKWLYRYSLEVGQAGMVTPRTPIEIGGATRSISISGLALGKEEGNLRWIRRDSDTAMVHPEPVYPTGGNIHLYYEVYGLDAGSSYSAAVEVSEKRGNRAGRPRLRFAFEEEAEGEITALRRSMRLDGLEPGEYWIKLVIRDAHGTQVVAQKAIRVITLHNETRR